MTELATLLEGIAAVLWPVVVLLLVVRFSPAVLEIIQSAKSRRFTLKIGGQELSMEEANKIQGNLIADLQLEVGRLKERLEASGSSVVPAASRKPEPARRAPAILWVDDNPKNNSFITEQLIGSGISVDLARSTAEALEKLANSSYSVMISDLGRREGRRYEPLAGLALLEAVKRSGASIPAALFTSSRGVSQHEESAREHGADLITSSSVDLLRWLRTRLPEWEDR